MQIINPNKIYTVANESWKYPNSLSMFQTFTGIGKERERGVKMGQESPTDIILGPMEGLLSIDTPIKHYCTLC